MTLTPDERNRLKLNQTLNAIAPEQLNMIIFTLSPPAGIIPPLPAPQGQRVAALLNWAGSPSGCDLVKVQEVLNEIVKQNTEVESKNLAKLLAQEQGEEQIEQKFQELNELDNQSLDKNLLIKQFDDYIRQIDFKKAKVQFSNLLNNYENEPWATLMLMHESSTKRGDIYLEYIKDELKNLKRDFKHYPIGLSSDSFLDETGLINKIAGYLGITARENQEKILKEIINTIGNSITDGTILFFHISQWDELDKPAQTLEWFIQKFWNNLITKIIEVCNNSNFCLVKVITIIDFSGSLDENFLNLSCLCRFNNFNIQTITQFSVLEIPLTNWTQKEINNWLAIYTKIDSDIRQEKSRRIWKYQTQEGDPQKTYEKLKEIWLQYPKIIN